MNGSIQHRPDRPKPWRARYLAGDGRQRSKSFSRKVDAERWLRDQLAQLDRGVWVDPNAGDVTFAAWSAEWLRGLDVKPKTLAGYESLLRSRVLPRFGTVPLRRIAPADVRGWLAEMSAEGLSASRVRQARQLLRAALETAVADGTLGRNPVEHVRAPTARPREHRFLTAGQVAGLSEAAERRQDGAALVVRFLVWSGLRWGEMVALRRSSIDPLRRRVTVAASATEISGRLVFGTPKSHRARTVILPRFVSDELATHLASVELDGLVFTAPGGGPLRVGNFRKAVWLPAVADCGLDGLRVHDLRHTCASLAISAGASVKAVQRMLGHASATVTLDTYAALFTDDLEALADRLDERFGDPDVAQAWPKASARVIAIGDQPG